MYNKDNHTEYFEGIFGHHNITGKVDPTPALIMDELIKARNSR